MCIQLVERSVKYPRGIAEDVLVKVDKFVIPVDFVVLDMPQDFDVSLILGRLFLTTAQALIDVGEGKLILRVREEKVTFCMVKLAKQSCQDVNECFLLDAIDPPGEEGGTPIPVKYQVESTRKRCLIQVRE
ncbi:unnamed protein product [Cuscuta europaea]|uniref:Uncharacterized protein n=1 Tax=Cuscuta europaea TaxID=41803 RepID=A0A9P1A0C2_CUSEU|nr:unnamed protein product [Cuscuta europaea]